jgi:hypothetical protein
VTTSQYLVPYNEDAMTTLTLIDLAILARSNFAPLALIPSFVQAVNHGLPYGF